MAVAGPGPCRYSLYVSIFLRRGPFLHLIQGKLEATDKGDLVEKFKAVLQTYADSPDHFLTPEGIRPIEELFNNENLNFMELWNEALREASSATDA